MGPDNSTPVRLFFVDPETGERTELPKKIPEIAITGTEGDEPMSYFGGCGDCSHADHKRKQGEKVRCTRWSQWVNPHGKPCEERTISFPLNIDPMKHLEMMQYFYQKNGGNLA